MARKPRTSLRIKRLRIRKRVNGTAERPRLILHRTNLNLFVEVFDDEHEKTLLGASTLNQSLKTKGLKQWGNVKGSELFAEYVAEALSQKGIKHIVFDRGGRPYHGRIKAFADVLRKKGIQF